MLQLSSKFSRSVAPLYFARNRPRLCSSGTTRSTKLLEASRRVGCGQHESVSPAVIHVMLHLVGDIRRGADRDRHSHALGIDHGGFLHGHGRAALGVDIDSNSPWIPGTSMFCTMASEG
jgi:hypothetical protein